MSVIIAHPSVAPFVQHAARAILEAGRLDRFITTLRYDPDSRAQRFACAIARCAGKDLRRQLARRAITELPISRVESLPWGEILRLAVSRLDPSGLVTDRVWSHTEPAFDRAVARRLSDAHEAVYGYEYASLATFARARALGMRTYYDVPAPETRFVRSVLDPEIARFPALQTAYVRRTARQEPARTYRRQCEWDAADVVIAASTFTRASFAKSGYDAGKIRVVPYGAPPPVGEAEARRGGSSGGALRLLWAGTFSVRKGAHRVVEAWRRHRLGRIAQLRVYGAIALPEEVLRPIPDGIEFGGSIPRTELMKWYEKSDALLFPTLCDGFGLVVTEAWSQGLPVLTTPNAGASDLLKEGENGFLFPAGDTDALAAMIVDRAGHREELRDMRAGARDTAAKWQWSDYRRALRAAMESSEP